MPTQVDEELPTDHWCMSKHNARNVANNATDHVKHIRAKNIGNHLVISGHLYWEIYGKDMLKSSAIVFCFNLNLFLFDLLI